MMSKVLLNCPFAGSIIFTPISLNALSNFDVKPSTAFPSSSIPLSVAEMVFKPVATLDIFLKLEKPPVNIPIVSCMLLPERFIVPDILVSPSVRLSNPIG